MKNIFNLFATAFVSLVFFSCSKENLVDSNPSAELFEYSLINVPITNAEYIAAADERTLFVCSPDASWIITDGNAQKINFQDASFRAYKVEAIDKDYAVFSGTNSSGNIFKIYENGNIRSVTPPMNSNGSLHLLQKNVFVTSSADYLCYFFKDSSFTQYIFDFNEYLYKAGRFNNENYLITREKDFTAHIYKQSSEGIAEVYWGVGGIIFILSDNILRVQSEGPLQYTLYNFTGTGWELIFTHYVSNYYEHPRFILGSSLDFLIEVGTVGPGAEKMLIKVRKANSITNQTNFPDYIFPISGPDYPMVSQYKNNTFYLYKNMGDGGRIIKVKLKS